MTRWRATTAAIAFAGGLGLRADAAPDATASYWFVKQPDATAAFPLVSVRGGAISRCDRSCMRAVRNGARMRSVRRDGGPGGDVRVIGVRHSDTAPTEEIVLASPTKGELLVSEGHHDRPIIRIGTLMGEPLREMEAFIRPLDDLVIDRSAPMLGAVPPLPSRLTVFPFTVDGHESLYAVITGPSLAIAVQNARRQWILQHLEQATAPEGFYAQAFRLVAIVDMDGDGLPEIVAVKQMGESWWDLVLHYKKDGDAGGWMVVATVPGGTA